MGVFFKLWIQNTKTLWIVKPLAHQKHGPKGWFIIIHKHTLILTQRGCIQCSNTKSIILYITLSPAHLKARMAWRWGRVGVAILDSIQMDLLGLNQESFSFLIQLVTSLWLSSCLCFSSCTFSISPEFLSCSFFFLLDVWRKKMWCN